ncbi:MAG: DUF882 domain-containing protein [Rickettsiales bacterium]|nr:DUF882 domain-containing protein [Rickettsiales bacterium]
MNLSRRQFLQGSAAAATSLVIAPSAMATYQITPYAFSEASKKKTLSFYHTHTGESLETVFYDGGLVRDGLVKANRILRDHRSGDVIEMDSELLFTLHDIKEQLGTDEPFHIISGYRSPKTNAMLRSKGKGVAKKSFHMRGMAIDIRVPGIKTSGIRDLAKEMQRGGVGYYSSSDFVHLDTGPARFW